MAQKKTQKIADRETMALDVVVKGLAAIVAAHPQTNPAYAAKLIEKAAANESFDRARAQATAHLANRSKAVHMVTGLKPPVAPILAAKPVLKPPVKVQAKATATRKRA